MVYDINGDITVAYNVNGNLDDDLYDVEGNPLGSFTPLVVMTYNYQWCSGINSQIAMQEAIIDEYKPDIIGIQEAGKGYSSRQQEWPTVATSFLDDYSYKYLSDHYNYNGLASKIALSNVTDTDYTQNDDEDWSYQKCYFTFDGKTIAWFNTHLTWRTDSATLLRKYSQAEELFAAVEEEEYAIVTGDFNMYGDSLSSADYIGIGKQFADAGYKMANWTTKRFVKTWTDSAVLTSLSDFTYACDNIITTPNILIAEVIFDTTKFDYLNGNSIDHIPVIARLKIN